MRPLAIVGLMACGRPDEPKPPTTLFVKGKLTWDDVRQIELELPPAAPYVSKTAQAQTDDSNWMTYVVGTTTDYFALRKLAIGSGRVFDPSDGGRVAVIGDKLVKTLHVKLGDTLRLDKLGFKVVGILAHQGIAETGQDLDDLVLVPSDELKRGFLSTRGISMIVGDPSRIEALRELLHVRHRGADDFTISTPP